MSDVTRILSQIEEGDPKAAEERAAWLAAELVLPAPAPAAP